MKKLFQMISHGLKKMQAAKQAGFDYIEISIDESDERLARLDWSDEQIEEIRSYMKETGSSFQACA